MTNVEYIVIYRNDRMVEETHATELAARLQAEHFCCQKRVAFDVLEVRRIATCHPGKVMWEDDTLTTPIATSATAGGLANGARVNPSFWKRS